MRRTYLVPLIVVLILAAAVGAYVLWPRSRVFPESLVGRDAPAITLKELATGRLVRLPADLAGRPYSIQFFSYG